MTEMRNVSSMARHIAATAGLSLASMAAAAGDSGTESMGEMTVTGAQFMMMLGGFVGLGVVVWLVVKAMNR